MFACGRATLAVSLTPKLNNVENNLTLSAVNEAPS